MAEFVLITGRTAKQGAALSRGKDSSEYRQATGFVQMSREDRECLGVEEGRRVRLRTVFGEAELELREGDVPPGMLFVPLGPAANTLIAADTQGTGMPDSKGLVVEVELI
ncbi:MAG: formylmethanofuran dehydrogenase [Anaerolineae bacterium]|jgi:formylmethanofuran dehydrogenase subunit D|nr:formylmethanofuran dehydrogenase [Anaerolineae bacterium]MDH7474338.1 molybdopterin dinucleotide binding domain-containing protein [Anaerolineae bacterium]